MHCPLPPIEHAYGLGAASTLLVGFDPPGDKSNLAHLRPPCCEDWGGSCGSQRHRPHDFFSSPFSGLLREPLLKVYALLRSCEYSATLGQHLHIDVGEATGQQHLMSPTVVALHLSHPVSVLSLGVTSLSLSLLPFLLPLPTRSP